MGDGITKRVAVIINGDPEKRHLGNVERAIARFQKDGFDEVHVVSTKAPSSSTLFTDISNGQQALNTVLDGLRSKLDDDDVLSVYITGHGDLRNGSACVVTPNHCISLLGLAQKLDAIPHGYRTLFMDQCFSGQEAHRFVSPKTTLLAIGSPGETVSCQLFTPEFFSDNVPDFNNDGIISMRERYEHAVGRYDASTALFYSAGLATDLAGHKARKAPFRKETTKVSNKGELAATLRGLKPGQLALVNFSADWCKACKPYEPVFDKLAEQLNGKYLMIQAKGVGGSDEDWQTYGISELPTVAFIDWQGNVFPVEDRNNPEASLSKIIMTPQAYAKSLETRYFEETDTDKKIEILGKIADLGSSGLPSLTKIGHSIFSGADQKLQESYLTKLADATRRAKGTDEKMLGDLFWKLAEQYPKAIYEIMDSCGTSRCRTVGRITWGKHEELNARVDARADDPKTPVDLRKIIVIWRYSDSKANFALLQSDPNPEIRRVAARALTSFIGQWKPFIEKAVVIARSDPDPTVRRLVIEGLSGVMDMPASIYGLLCQGLSDPQEVIQRASAEGLKRLHFFADKPLKVEQNKGLQIMLTEFQRSTNPFAKVVLARALLKAPKDEIKTETRKQLAAYIRSNVRHRNTDIRAQASAALTDIVVPTNSDRKYLCGLIKAERDIDIRATLIEALYGVVDDKIDRKEEQEIAAVVVANLRSDNSTLTESALRLVRSISRHPSSELVETVTQGLYAANDSSLQDSYLNFFVGHPKHFTAKMEEDLKLLDADSFYVIRTTLLIIQRSSPEIRAKLRPKIAKLAEEKNLKQELKKLAQTILSMDS